MAESRTPKDGRRARWLPVFLISLLGAFGFIWYLAAWPFTVITVDGQVDSVVLNGSKLIPDQYGYSHLRLPPWKSRLVVTDKKGNSAAYVIWPQKGTNDSGFIVIRGLNVNAPDVVGVEMADL